MIYYLDYKKMDVELAVLMRNKNYWLYLLDDNSIRLVYEYTKAKAENRKFTSIYSDMYQDLGLIDDEEFAEICRKYTLDIDYYKDGIFYFHYEYRHIRGDFDRVYFARRAVDFSTFFTIFRELNID